MLCKRTSFRRLLTAFPALILTAALFCPGGGDGYAMFKDAEQIATTMMVDNEVVMRYIEENHGGVIPESYARPQGRILIDGQAQSLDAAA